ncbi:helix-turn-helix domain-containing protein [Oceanobacillus salinisoli]|uniref:helix-turn-helix domain-containing protein n=1 Tax=Oceanobacillus salinisoli TaxID=2678611 RepID=UPI0012E31115|nr:AraC family transcriptional regulator [Oceanobacillus salinisoli]
MSKTYFLPMLTQDFEIYHMGPTIETSILRKHNESAWGGLESTEPFYQLHSHEVFEIFILVDGECEYFCEGMTYNLKKGDVVVIPPYAVHRVIANSLDQYERFVVTISQHLMNDFEYSSPLLKENTTFQKANGIYMYHLDSKSFQHMVSLLKSIIKKIKEGKEKYSFTLQYQLFQALELIFNPTKSAAGLSKKNELDERLVSILEYIEEHLTDPALTLEHVSERFYLSKYYFSHYFKEKMNLPFYRYVTLKRLSLALSMIKQNEISIKEIAVQCGFVDYSSFYRLFKKEYNMSPKTLQKEFKL